MSFFSLSLSLALSVCRLGKTSILTSNTLNQAVWLVQLKRYQWIGRQPNPSLPRQMHTLRNTNRTWLMFHHKNR